MKRIDPNRPGASRASWPRRAGAAPKTRASAPVASAVPDLPSRKLERQLGLEPVPKTPLPIGPSVEGPVHLLLQSRARRAAPAVHVTDGPGGKVARGNLPVLHQMDLEVLRDVTVLAGDLVLAETSLKPHELSALASLEIVEGRLSLEGNLALSDTGALSRVRRVGRSLYVGFNEALARLALPALEETGALVVEDNPALAELSLPSLRRVSRYLHVERNPALTAFDLDLTNLDCELSVVENGVIENGVAESSV